MFQPPLFCSVTVKSPSDTLELVSYLGSSICASKDLAPGTDHVAFGLSSTVAEFTHLEVEPT